MNFQCICVTCLIVTDKRHHTFEAVVAAVSRYNDFMNDCPDGVLSKEVSCRVSSRLLIYIIFHRG